MNKRIRLIIIDSVASLFRGIPNDIKQYKNNIKSAVSKLENKTITNDIKKIANYLHNLTHEHKTALICINQMSDIIDKDVNLPFVQYFRGSGYISYIDKSESIIDQKLNKIPCLGLTWSQNITTRILITKFTSYINYDDLKMRHDYYQRDGKNFKTFTYKNDTNLVERYFYVALSPHVPCQYSSFYITKDGLTEKINIQNQ
ncbi:unnamed protein product [Gordionus sp. m RMFG-2023]